VRAIAKRKAIELNKKETDELLKNLGKEARIATVENSTSNKVLTDIITGQALSKILDIKKETLRDHRKKGLPYIKVGNKTYFSQKSVYIWLLKQEKEG
jgi:hypothetical protein